MGRTTLLTHRRFGPLFLAQILGSFNDNFLKNALVILVTFRSMSVLGLDPEQMIPVAGICYILPFFLFSAPSGWLADRMNKARLLRWVKAAEVGIMGLAVAGFAAQSPGVLLAALFLMGTHSTVFGPSKYSILPQLLRDDELVSGNALLETGTNLAILAGTLLGGLMVGREPVLGGVLMMCVAVVGLVAAWLIPDVSTQHTSDNADWRPIAIAREQITIARRDATVWNAILGISTFWALTAAFLALFPPYTKTVVHGSEGVASLFLATYSFGIGLGAMVCARLSRPRLELGLVPLGAVGMAMFILDLYRIGSPWPSVGTVQLAPFLMRPISWRILADIGMTAFSSGIFLVPFNTLVQVSTNPSERTRVMSANNLMNSLFVVAFALVQTVGLRYLPTLPFFLGIGALNVMLTLWLGWRLPALYAQFVAWFVVKGLLRLGIEGAERVPARGPVVLAARWGTPIRALAIVQAGNRPFRVVIGRDGTPGWLGWVLGHLGYLPLHASPATALGDGEAVCVFTSDPDPVALSVPGTPIIPVYVVGGHRWYERIRVRFGLPRDAIARVGASASVSKKIEED